MSELELREQEAIEQAALRVEAEPELVMPLTGELLDLRKPEQVAYGLEQVREIKRSLDQLRQLLEAVLRSESAKQGTKTLHLDGWDAEVKGGQKTVYDAEELAHDLEAAGLPPDRLAQAIKVVVEYKVDQRVLRQLASASPAYAEVVEKHRRVEPSPVYVSVKRTPKGA